MSPFSLRQLKATYARLQQAWHTTLLLDPLPWNTLFHIHFDSEPRRTAAAPE